MCRDRIVEIDLAAYAVVAKPQYSDGQLRYARSRRASLFAMACEGSAIQLFD